MGARILTLPAILALGLVFGMQHALEADHLAAVATLAARERSFSGTLRQGVAWGIGHTLTLLAFGVAILLAGRAISGETAQHMEAVVGVMLVALGVDLLRRMRRDRVHFHAHGHDDGAWHFHAHAHGSAHGPHDVMHHRHEHRPLPLRAMLVGMVHGMAGSAALVLVALEKLASPVWGIAYVLLFGVGSIAGMALLSLAISFPLRGYAARFIAIHRGVHCVLAIVTIALGVRVFLMSAG